MISYDIWINPDEKKHISLTSVEQEELNLLKELYEEGAEILVLENNKENNSIRYVAYTKDIYKQPQYPVAVIVGSTAKFVHEVCSSPNIYTKTNIELEQLIHKLQKSSSHDYNNMRKVGNSNDITRQRQDVVQQK